MQLPKCQQQPIQVSRKNFACRRNICEEKGETSSRAIKWPRGIESSWMDNRLDIKGGLSGVGLKTLYLIFHPRLKKHGSIIKCLHMLTTNNMNRWEKPHSQIMRASRPRRPFSADPPQDRSSTSARGPTPYAE